jgi:hypothetical protein
MSYAGRLFDRALQLAAERMLRAWWAHEINPLTVLQRTVTREAADYITEHGDNAILYDDRKRHLLQALKTAPTEGLVLEFGVHRGDSMRWIANDITPRLADGFDSFEGLPSGGGGTHWYKQQFDRGSQIPKVPANASLYKGWFRDTLPPFLGSRSEQTAAFVHIDCDLYESTKDIFDILDTYLIPGTVIVFDDYYNLPNWRQHEHRAFREFCERRNLGYDYIGFSRQQASVVLRG